MIPEIVPFDLMAKEEKPTSFPMVDASTSPVVVSPASAGSSIPTGDWWFSQLPVVASRSQFNGLNIHLWVRHIQVILRPQNLLDHLTGTAPVETDPHYKKWIVEEEVLYTWILDSMTAELVNRFIEYETVKAIWDAVHKYHSKKSDESKIAQLVTLAVTLQQADKSILTYANELSSIYSELDHYRPPAHKSVDREYVLMDRVYKLLQGLNPDFESIQNQLHYTKL